MRMTRQDGAVLLVTIALFVGVFLARLANPDPAKTLTLLYLVPIAVLAARFGAPAGVLAVGVAIGLTAAWVWRHDIDLSLWGWTTRIVAFTVAGLGVGLLTDRVSRMLRERERLIADAAGVARLQEQTRAVQKLTARLSRAATVQDAAAAYTSEGLELLGAVQGGVFLLEDDARLRLVSLARPLSAREDWTTVALALRTPPSDAARTRQPIYLPDPVTMDAAYPNLTGIRREVGDQAWAATPLNGSRGVLGSIAAAYDSPRDFGPAQRELFEVVAARVAEAAERAALLDHADEQRARAEAAERRATLLADVGAVLTAAFDAVERVQRLVDLLVPRFADLAMVQTRPGPVHFPAEPWAVWSTRPDPEMGSDPEVGSGIRPEPDRGVVPAVPAGALDLPLVTRGHVLAHLVLARDPGARAGAAGAVGGFDEEDEALARLVAGRAALALDNAQLFERQRDVVTTLQHALLPGELPQVDGVEVSARYRPGSAGLEVGGDWYDLIALPDGRVGIVLGDVVGRGVTAAAAMGQLRSALAALAPYSVDPAQLLRRMDGFAATVPGARLATLVYLDYLPRTGVLRYSSAGHPPPLLVDRAGHVQRLDQARGVPLAAGVELPRPCAELVLDRPAVLVCYSDGLVERRGEPVDESVDRLVDRLRALPASSPDRWCDQVLHLLDNAGPAQDDVALLIAELDRVVAEFRFSLAPDGELLAELRVALRAWAEEEADLGAELTADLLLAVNEACANAIEHAFGAGRSRPRGRSTRGVGDRRGRVEVLAHRLSGGELVARVSDSGRWRPEVVGPSDRGRGLNLIRSVMDEVSLIPGSEGTTVLMRRRANAADASPRGVAQHEAARRPAGAARGGDCAGCGAAAAGRPAPAGLGEDADTAGPDQQADDDEQDAEQHPAPDQRDDSVDDEGDGDDPEDEFHARSDAR